jgi:hypothetical protein
VIHNAYRIEMQGLQAQERREAEHVKASPETVTLEGVAAAS